VFSCRRSLTDDADSRRSTIDLDATPVGESSNGYIGKFRVVLIDKRALRDLETLNHASQHVANFVSVPVGKFEVSAAVADASFAGTSAPNANKSNVDSQKPFLTTTTTTGHLKSPDRGRPAPLPGHDLRALLCGYSLRFGGK